MAFRITVEVPAFLTFVAFLIADSVNTNLMIYRTCYVTLGYDKHNCSLLGISNATRKLEQLVQPHADIIIMTKTLIDQITAAILCLFVGPWSDTFGRKPILALNLAGYTAMSLVMVVFSAVETASPWFMMTCSIPVILTGGGATLLTVFLAYLTDITSESERGFRMGVLEVTLAAAVLIGSASSSYVFSATGYMAVYGIGAALCFLALLYTVFLLPESLQEPETAGRLKGLFRGRNLSGMFWTSFKNRPQYNRAILLSLVLALALFFVIVAGDGSVMFLFMREKFHWTLRQYTWYNTASNLMFISSTCFVVYIVHHKLHVKESWIVFLGFISLTAGALIQGLAQVDWLIYAAAVVKLPSGGLSPMTRSLLSKLVDSAEAGKIFALITVIQNALGLIGSPIYINLYNATLSTNPSVFNYLTSGILAASAGLLLGVLVLQRRTSREDYSRLEAESAPSDHPIDSSDRLVN
ncbi:proton-coupled folate transporter [Dendroctonus ponderosae]|uniref:proton-coupled folate transporter n=1 Tax=Dendroctonus ponderosae TaxID=77166 RepID=UPI0020353CAC|nr:proton-coupled folate transporter [Dendroctonus ponderosae]